MARATWIAVTAAAVAVALPTLGSADGSGASAVRGDDFPPGYSHVIGAEKAVCTKRSCKLEFTCDEAGEDGCVFSAAIAPRQAVLWAYLTRPLVCVAKTPEDCPPYPQAGPNIFESGETRTVKMKTVKPGRKLIKRALKKGKRKLPGGDWEVFRPDVPGEITFETGDLKKIKLRG